jgi:glycosyltransferase involved in cell wall biosynthesis
VQRFAWETLTSLDEILDLLPKKEMISLTLLVPKDFKEELRLRNIKIKKIGLSKGHLWEQFFLPFFSFKNLLINLCNTAPIFKKKQIVTIHDISILKFPSAYSYLFRIYYFLMFKIITKSSQKIITNSNFTKSEISKYFKIDDSKIKPIHLGGNHLFKYKSDKKILSEYLLEGKQYILAIGSLNSNKNFHGILEAFKLLNISDFLLVIIGEKNERVFKTVNLPSNKNVVYIKYISDEGLRALYENAFCLLYPSFYEGFGIPPLEAMSFGCPVIVSNTSSLPEVCGDAALYCDPFSPKDIVDKIKILIANKNLYRQLKDDGAHRVKMFSWKKCGTLIWEIINGQTQINVN